MYEIWSFRPVSNERTQNQKFDVDDYLDKKKTYHYSPAIKSFIEGHVVSTYYSISILREKDLSADNLKQKLPSFDWPQDLETLPCPILDQTNEGKFLSYSEVKTSKRDYSDKCRPGKYQKIPSNIPFPKNKQRAVYGAPVEIKCENCGKQRVAYFKLKPTKALVGEVSNSLKFVRYICGGRISSFGRSLAVVEEITGAVGNIVDIEDEIDNDLISESHEEEVSEEEGDLMYEDHGGSGNEEESASDVECFDLNANTVVEAREVEESSPGSGLYFLASFLSCDLLYFSVSTSLHTSSSSADRNLGSNLRANLITSTSSGLHYAPFKFSEI